MPYHYGRKIDADFDAAVSRVTEALKNQGFGIPTEIDVGATLKKKLDVDFRPCKISGACNPPYACKALQAEDKIGTMLPCNVIVQASDDGQVEIAAIDPAASTAAVDNSALEGIAKTIGAKLHTVVQEA